jgi:dolichyl-diphosphooligosaccharide--protein glycosyltransferase
VNQLKSPLADHRATLLVFLCILAVYGLSYYKRQASYTHWMENRSEYVVDHVTAMSTTDAYHWLKMARDMEAGKLGKDKIDPLKEYPDSNIYTDKPSLLAKFIRFSALFTNGDYYQAGLFLIPLLAGLFVFPLFLYFNTLGFGASAVLGGLVGSFSLSYYSRSYLGYVDTDMLNTFFPIAISTLNVMIGRERSFRTNFLLAVGAGLTMYLFNWWYQQPVFFLVYLFVMIVYLLLSRIHWQQMALILLAFTLTSGPQYVLQSVQSLLGFYNVFFSPLPTGQLVWPDILITTTESHKYTVMQNLTRMHGFLPVVFVGLAGLLYLCIAHARRMVPIARIVSSTSIFGRSLAARDRSRNSAGSYSSS